MGKTIAGHTVATTRAGDGYERRAFTADEIWRMQDLGIIDDAEGFELIEGDIVMMQSKNAPHDLSVFPIMDSTDVQGPDVLLAIEVAATTLRKDLKLKAALYAKYDVREYWVIGTKKLTTTIHMTPVGGAWGSVEVLSADAVLTHESAPGFAVRLVDI